MSTFRTGRRRDGSKYHYPIAPKRNWKRIGSNVLAQRPAWRVVLPRIERHRLSESSLGNILSSFLYQTPILRELYSAYNMADSIYSNWRQIKELCESYKEEGLAGVIDSRAAHHVLVGYFKAERKCSIFLNASD